jgi:hypothetical protein
MAKAAGFDAAVTSTSMMLLPFWVVAVTWWTRVSSGSLAVTATGVSSARPEITCT